MTDEREDTLDHPGFSEAFGAMASDARDLEAQRARDQIAAELFGVQPTATRIDRFIVLDRLGAGGMGVVYDAYDSRLERRVAIKVVKGPASSGRERLLGEAKAMAKLAHPNVVPIYEVGEHGGCVFIAMERVVGSTLRQWCAAGPRSSDEILDKCLDAGRGLAAAHAAGIVHGDFTPENVIVGDDGRARVLDFGLAEYDALETAPDGASDRDASPPSVRGGTPRYMAPEQRREGIRDALSDQFAYCVTVWEAMTGVHPLWPTADAPSRAGGRRGELTPAVERRLRRGMADLPDAPFRGRFAGVDTLLELLAGDRRRRRARARVAMGFAAVIVSATAASAMQSSDATTDPCIEAVAAIDATFPANDRSAEFARLASVGGEYGAEVAPRLGRLVDAFVASWKVTRNELCVAQKHDPVESDEHELRRLCMHASASSLVALRRAIARVDAEGLPRLVVAVDTLPAPERCADPTLEMIAAKRAHPDAQTLVERLAEARTFYDVGDFAAAASAAEQAVTLARAQDPSAYLPEALLVDSQLKLTNGQAALAASQLAVATRTALELGDFRVAVETWGTGAWARAISGDSDKSADTEGRVWFSAIAAGLPGALAQMRHHEKLAMIDLARGDTDGARASYRRALELSATFEVAQADLSHLLQGLALATEDPQSREALFEQAVNAASAAFGPEHPRTLDARMIWAGNVVEASDSRELLLPTCHAYAAYHPYARDAIAECYQSLALVAELSGEVDLAASATDAWFENEDTIVAGAMVAARRGDHGAAATALATVVGSEFAALRADTPFFVVLALGMHEIELGRAWRMLGDPRDAAMLARGLTHVERAGQGRALPAIAHRQQYARSITRGE